MKPIFHEIYIKAYLKCQNELMPNAIKFKRAKMKNKCRKNFFYIIQFTALYMLKVSGLKARAGSCNPCCVGYALMAHYTDTLHFYKK